MQPSGEEGSVANETADSEIQAKRRASCDRSNTHRLRKIFGWHRPDTPVGRSTHHFGGDLSEKASKTSDHGSSTTSRASTSDCSSLADHERAASWGPFLAEQDDSGHAKAEAEELPSDVTN